MGMDFRSYFAARYGKRGTRRINYICRLCRTVERADEFLFTGLPYVVGQY